MSRRPIGPLALGPSGPDARADRILRIDSPPIGVGAEKVCRIDATEVPLGYGGWSVLAWHARRVAAALGAPELDPGELQYARQLCRDAADPDVPEPELRRVLEELADLLVARTAVAPA